tara:strand:- start:965 stop:1618 length:654 start_codon:yes stop_codon:yes gene_type:complete
MYIEGDCHDIIKTIKTDSIDLIYNNPPFGTTENKWDTPLRWNELWKEIWRVLKPDGIAIIHAAKPFSYKLIQSQTPKYNYSWKKNTTTNFFHAKKQPLRQMEEIYIFYNKPGTYNPQMVGDKINKTSSAGTSSYYGSRTKKQVVKTVLGNYPTDFMDYKVCVRGGKTIGDDMIDYFIKTYSNEGDTVLDFTTHNDTVGNKVKLLNRKFIGIDKNINK